ncbi:hypothetical protein HD806DRAFT_485041 [Xylariaceae sp. AK1471]|nr:hypothetical protein HD806DRAFT_485041 [Xylariaceae sp. AK1471]
MSGIEIVGIVLGAIPLVISALEHYGEGVHTIARWRKYKREKQSLVRNLNTEHVKLQDICEKLLLGIVPESRIEAMIKNPFGDLWRDEHTQKKIKARLWKGYSSFEDTMTEIKMATDEMKKRIDSQGGKNDSNLKRVLFTLSRSQYSDLMLTIKDGIVTLEKLTDRNMELEPARKVRSQGKLFALLRDMSKGLYNALRSSLDCACRHDVSLRLEKRSADFTPMDYNDIFMGDLTFQLALSYQPTYDDACGLVEVRKWEEVLIKATTMPKEQTPVFRALDTTVQPRKGRFKKSVSFASSTTAASSTITLVEPEPYSQNRNVLSPTFEIQQSIQSLSIGVASIGLSNSEAKLNLCEKMNRAQKQTQVSTYGTIIDQSSHNTRKYTVDPISVPDYEDTRCWSVVSLKDILQQKDNSVYLSTEDRLQLAVVISSSILQLHGSPWLARAISSQDIFFIQKHSYPIYGQPFLIRKLPDDNSSSVEETPDTHLKRNPTLLALGVLLIELFLGETIDSLRTPKERSLSCTDLLLNYMTVKRLIERVRGASSNYATAITRCVDGELHSSELTLDSEDFCHDIYSGVVSLLENDVAHTQITK